MPDKYIIYREDFKNNGASKWADEFESLTTAQKNDFLRIVRLNNFCEEAKTSRFSEVNELLTHYKKGKSTASE